VRRIGGVIHHDNVRAGRYRAPQFLLRELIGLSGCKRLRRDRTKTGGFQFRECGSENSLDAAEKFHQASALIRS
jgi:hypothetical protein